MSKFRKKAAGPAKTKVPIGLPSPDQIKDWLFSSNSSDVFSEEDMKRNLQFLTALIPGFTDNYSPSAFYHALELDNKRGYNDKKHSQGAYEMLDPNLMKAVEEFKKNPPSNLKDFVSDKPIDKIENITVPETSDRYKAKQEQLYPSSASPSSTSAATSTATSNSRFVKTSANSGPEQLKKLVPNWDIKNVLNDMNKIARRKDLSDREKQQGMANILSQYEKSIAPLHQYLSNNGIKYK